MHLEDSDPPQPLRALVIDDDRQLTRILSRALTEAGLQVSEAHDGAEGLVLAHDLPAVIIVDLHMPVMDGLAFIDAFRGTPASDRVPIILTTSVADLQLVRRRIDGKGVVLVMPKPFDLES